MPMPRFHHRVINAKGTVSTFAKLNPASIVAWLLCSTSLRSKDLNWPIHNSARRSVVTSSAEESLLIWYRQLRLADVVPVKKKKSSPLWFDNIFSRCQGIVTIRKLSVACNRLYTSENQSSTCGRNQTRYRAQLWLLGSVLVHQFRQYLTH